MQRIGARAVPLVTFKLGALLYKLIERKSNQTPVGPVGIVAPGNHIQGCLDWPSIKASAELFVIRFALTIA